MYALKCPCCGRSAFKEYFYHTGEQYIFCVRCGYNYIKTIEKETADSVEYTEEKYDGHGMLILVKKDGSRQNIMLNVKITQENLEKYRESFMDDQVNQEKSCLVSYEDGEFTILFGNPSENFYLSFEEYREKMFEKYGVPEFEFMVPIEH